MKECWFQMTRDNDEVIVKNKRIKANTQKWNDIDIFGLYNSIVNEKKITHVYYVYCLYSCSLLSIYDLRCCRCSTIYDTLIQKALAERNQTVYIDLIFCKCILHVADDWILLYVDWSIKLEQIEICKLELLNSVCDAHHF